MTKCPQEQFCPERGRLANNAALARIGKYLRYMFLIADPRYKVGQHLFVAQHSAVKIKISRDFPNAIRAFQHENIGYEKMCPTYLAKSISE